MPAIRSPIRHHLVPYRCDPEQGKARFFSLMIERDLFGTIRLVRNWGFVGSKGQEKAEIFPDEEGCSGLEVMGHSPASRCQNGKNGKRHDRSARKRHRSPDCLSLPH
jgi:predicted DNA-binding WGR domain protein